MEQKKQGRVFSFGYARVSRKEQVLDRQLTAIKMFRPDIDEVNIFKDEATGKNFDRQGYQAMKIMIDQYLKIINPDDTVELIIEELDRLGRDYKLIMEELRYWKDKGVVLRILEIPTTLMEVDSQNKWVVEMTANILIEVYAQLAQVELEKRAKRQEEGIAEAKKRGVQFGRKPVDIDMNLFYKVAERASKKEISHAEAMRTLGLKNNTYWKNFNILFPEYESRLKPACSN